MTREVCPKKAVFYLHANHEDFQRAQARIDEQRAECLRRANELGLMVVGEYFDRGRRVDPEQRPELSRLLAELRERPVAYVVTFDSARIAQNVHHFACVAWRLGKSGTRLEIASEPHREVGEEARSLISYIGSVQLIDPESNGSDR